jgi:hypothetical protein
MSLKKKKNLNKLDFNSSTKLTSTKKDNKVEILTFNGQKLVGFKVPQDESDDNKWYI